MKIQGRKSRVGVPTPEGASANPSVRATWARRAAAEYRSAAIAGEMLHWALTLGVPTPIVALVHDIVADELEHANLSREVHLAAGGKPTDIVVHRRDLSFSLFASEPLERRALAAAFSEFVVHESISLEAFRAISSVPLVPIVGHCVRTVLRDEARHRRSGTLLFQSLAQQFGELEWLQAWIPVAIQRLSNAYTADETVTDEERAWGLLDESAYKRAKSRALTRHVAKCVQDLGIPTAGSV